MEIQHALLPKFVSRNPEFDVAAVSVRCRAIGGDLQAHPLECADVGWFADDALPWPLAGFPRWGDLAFGAIRGEPIEPLFDEPRDKPWLSR